MNSSINCCFYHQAICPKHSHKTPNSACLFGLIQNLTIKDEAIKSKDSFEVTILHQNLNGQKLFLRTTFLQVQILPKCMHVRLRVMNLNLSATTNKCHLSESDVHKVYTHSYVASVAVDAFMSCNLTALCFFVFFIVPLFFYGSVWPRPVIQCSHCS